MQPVTASTAAVRGVALSFTILISALGCGRGHAETSPVPDPATTVPSPPIVVTDEMKAAQNDAASNVSEDDEWVPMTGSEQVIVGDLGGLTDDTPVRAAPAAEADQSLPGAQ